MSSHTKFQQSVSGFIATLVAAGALILPAMPAGADPVTRAKLTRNQILGNDRDAAYAGLYEYKKKIRKAMAAEETKGLREDDNPEKSADRIHLYIFGSETIRNFKQTPPDYQSLKKAHENLDKITGPNKGKGRRNQTGNIAAATIGTGVAIIAENPFIQIGSAILGAFGIYGLVKKDKNPDTVPKHQQHLMTLYGAMFNSAGTLLHHPDPEMRKDAAETLVRTDDYARFTLRLFEKQLAYPSEKPSLIETLDTTIESSAPGGATRPQYDRIKEALRERLVAETPLTKQKVESVAEQKVGTLVNGLPSSLQDKAVIEFFPQAFSALKWTADKLEYPEPNAFSMAPKQQPSFVLDRRIIVANRTSSAAALQL